MKSLTYQILLNLKNNISATINKVKEEFKAIDESAKKAGESANRFNTLCGKISNLDFSNIVSMGERAAQSMQTAIDAGFTYEQSMADLSSITGITGKELEDLGRVARETGVTSGLGAAGAADAFALLASQIQVDKIGMEGLKVLQKETITLAQAGGLAMTDAATAMAATINQFGLEASEANRVINVLAAGSKYGAAEVGDLAQSFKVTGSVAAAAGLSVEQTAGAIEVLSKSNVKGAEAGTALRNILLKMQTTLGLDLSKVGLVKALESLKPKLKDVTFLSKTFGMENVATAQFLIGNAAAVNEMTQAVTGTSVATEQAATRTATAGEKLKRMQATIDNLKIGLFEATGAFAPYISIVSEAAPALASLAIAIRMAGMAAAFAAKQNLLLKASTLATIVISKSAAAATALFSGANVVLNAVLTANPIGIVIVAIGALVAGIIIAYKNCDAFREIVDKVWAKTKELAVMLWENLVGAFNAVSTAISNLWTGAKSLLGIETELEKATLKTVDATKKSTISTEDAAAAAAKLAAEKKKEEAQLQKTLSTIGGVNQKLAELKTAQEKATGTQAIALEKEIQVWKDKLAVMQANITMGAANMSTIGGITAHMAALKTIQDSANGTQAIALEKEIRLLKKKLALMQNALMIGGAEAPDMKLLEAPTIKLPKIEPIKLPITVDTSVLAGANDKIKKSMDTLKDNPYESMQSGLSGIAGTMQSLSGIVGESAGAWLTWGGSLLQTIGQAIPQIMLLAGTQVTAANAQTAANMTQAATGAAASQSAIPIVGPILAIAAIASVMAAMMAIPKPKAFANGGIVYGNTFAQVGEYAGAANNPEVIAPLNKLKTLIQPAAGFGGEVTFRIEGNALIGLLNKVNNKNSRTR